jgi:predicted dehydrogenase
MINLAIIGTGIRANTHARAFTALENCTIVACCDIDEKKAKAFAQKWGIPDYYNDIDKLLSESKVDAATIVTSDKSHCMLAIKCLEAGKHVLCEKPLASNAEEARRMVEVAEKSGLINQVAFSYRRSGALYEAKRLIDSGALGEVRHIEGSYLQAWLSLYKQSDFDENFSFGLWRISKELSSGTLGDIGVHLLDFCTFPVGSVRSVNCLLQSYEKTPGNQAGDVMLDANDSAVISVRFNNGAIGTLHTTRWAYGHRNSIKLSVWGTRGALKIDLDQSYDSLNFCNTVEGGPLDFNLPFKWTSQKCSVVPDEYERFARSIESGENLTPDFRRGAEIQSLIAGCFESAEKAAWIDLP